MRANQMMHKSQEMSTTLPVYGRVNDYDSWNHALARWAVHNIPEGTPIYLSIDESVLLTVARNFAGLGCRNIEEACVAFRKALISRCVKGVGDEAYVDLDTLRGTDSNRIPRSVAFLGGMVFAAYQMQEDDIANDTNYFIRLRELLDLPTSPNSGRPRGMTIRQGGLAPEESVWEEWNRWLVQQGFQPTACQGEGHYDKYINYPISQVIFRRGDKARLSRWFKEQEQKGCLDRYSCDRDILAFRLRDLADKLPTKRLKQLFMNTEDCRRFEAIMDAAAEVYDSVDWDRGVADPDGGLLGSRRLWAGLYRTENFITGAIKYWLYPKMPRRWQGGALAIEHNGSSYELCEERPGWYRPLWPVVLNKELRYRIIGSDDITELVLPNRDFWILVHDPNDEASNALASWSLPAPGQTFLLLCQDKYTRQLNILREEQLLAWDEIVQVPQGDRLWYEYRECQVVSNHWSRVMPQPGCEDLLEALRPIKSVNIGLEGGLRVPGQSVWIEGHQPDLKLYQFGEAVQLQIVEVTTPDCPVFEGRAKVNERVPLPALAPGEYIIKAHGADYGAMRRMRIVSWSQLEARASTRNYSTLLNGLSLRGASLLIPGRVRE
ncbi:MAG: hypothetical protein RMJ88_08795 [Thermogemmata sp.]|nr:hypothetical protein [Thermogemmata sp.]